MADLLLSARALTKRFGGLAAVNGVSIDLWRGHIHAVIGPNGAGKSTLTNLLSGDLPPTTGQVHLGGVDTTGWTPERISRQGLARSYQKTNIFMPLTVHDNVRLAAQSREVQQPWNPLRWWHDTRTNTIKNRAVSARVSSAIELSGLQDRRTTIAGAMSHGEHREGIDLSGYKAQTAEPIRMRGDQTEFDARNLPEKARPDEQPEIPAHQQELK